MPEDRSCADTAIAQRMATFLYLFFVFLDILEIQGQHKRLTPTRSNLWGSHSWLEVACKGMCQVIIAVFFLVSLGVGLKVLCSMQKYLVSLMQEMVEFIFI